VDPGLEEGVSSTQILWSLLLGSGSGLIAVLLTSNIIRLDERKRLEKADQRRRQLFRKVFRGDS
jgi:Mg2+/citrate symporter